MKPTILLDLGIIALIVLIYFGIAPKIPDQELSSAVVKLENRVQSGRNMVSRFEREEELMKYLNAQAVAQQQGLFGRLKVYQEALMRGGFLHPDEVFTEADLTDHLLVLRDGGRFYDAMITAVDAQTVTVWHAEGDSTLARDRFPEAMFKNEAQTVPK